MSEAEPVAAARSLSARRSLDARSTSSARSRRTLLEVTGLPRARRRHDTPEGIAYRLYLRPMLRHLGLWPLPDFAVDAAREAGLAMLTLRRLEADLEALQTRSGPGRRRQVELRVEARIRKARVSKMLCERDLARLAKRTNGHGDGPTLKQIMKRYAKP